MIVAVCCVNFTWLTGSIVGFILGLTVAMIPAMKRAFF